MGRVALAGKNGEVKPGCIPFGKYRGTKFEGLPFGYIHYLLSMPDFKNRAENREMVACLEDVLAEYREQYEDDPSCIVLDFGKHEGSCLGDVPVDYVQWLVDQAWFQENPLYEYVSAYLEGETG